MLTFYNSIVVVFIAMLIGIGLRTGWDVSPLLNQLLYAICRDVWRGLRYVRRLLI